jgi:hypothetical protein
LQVHPLITTRPARKNCSPKVSADKKQASLSKTQQSSGNSGEKVEQGRELRFRSDCRAAIWHSAWNAVVSWTSNLLYNCLLTCESYVFDLLKIYIKH